MGAFVVVLVMVGALAAQAASVPGVAAQESTTATLSGITVNGAAAVKETIRQNVSADASLSALTLTDGTDSIGHLTPPFSSTTTEYEAGVGFGTEEVTMSGTSGHAAAEVSIAGSVTGVGSASHTLALSVGANSFIVSVRAEDGLTTQDYVVEVTRAGALTTLTPPPNDPAGAYPTTVKYKLTFQGLWDDLVSPSGVPGGAHFTTLIGGVHSDDVSFVTAGGTATAGVESMAETGGISGLRREVQAAIDAVDSLGDPEPTALSVVSGRLGGGADASATIDALEFTSQFPRLTVASMIAPTPDWFVGVSGLSMLDSAGHWLRSSAVNLYPWDAGSEDDVAHNGGFSLGGANTVPKEPIRSLQGSGPFTIAPIASLALTLESVATTRELDEGAAATEAVGAAVGVPVAAPQGGGSVAYSLAGADAGSFEVVASTGQIRTKSGVDYDYESRNGAGYEVMVVATYTAPDPDVVTNIDVSITLNNVDEPGTLSVAPPTAGVDVALSASITDPDGGVTGESYVWERSDNGNSGWSQVSTGSDYTLVGADEGKYVRVTVTYDDGHGTGRSLSQVMGPVAESTVRSNDSTLSALSLSGLTLSPTFAAGTTGYSVAAGYTAAATTVTATAAGAADGATLQITPADADAHTVGRQVALAIGATSIVIAVTAEDGSSQGYTVTVTRAQPTVTIAAATGSVNEGDEVAFVVTRSASAADALAVSVEVSETGDMIASGNEVAHSVTIPAGDTSMRLAIPSLPDDAWEDHSTVSAQVRSSTDYITGSAGEAQHTVSDDDFPEASAVLTVSSDSVDENQSVTATVTVITARAEEPNEDAGTLQLGTSDGPDPDGAGDGAAATAGQDYRAIASAAGLLRFERGDFVAGDGTNGCAARTYCASKDVTISTLDDDQSEAVERFTLSLAAVTTGASPTDSNIGIDSADASRHVDIAPNDQADKPGLQSIATPPPSSGGGGGGSSSGGGGGGDLDVGAAVLVVANGWSPSDVGTAAVLAARTADAVVVYTDGGVLSEPARLLVRETLPAEVIIVGGTAAVTSDVRSAIRAASSDSGVVRISGEDRVATSAQAARRLLGDPAGASGTTVVVANGWSPPDIGVAAALAASTRRSAVLYTEGGSLPDAAADLLREYAPTRVVIVGGTAAVSDEVLASIKAASPASSVSQVTGADRVATAAAGARRVLGDPAATPDGLTLVVANGWSPPDIGVAAAYAARTLNAAVLYTERDSLSKATEALLGEYRVSEVIIVGGTAAVTNDVRNAIREVASTVTVRRITGSDRADTAANAARRLLSD